MLRKTALTCTRVFSARKLSTATASKVSAKGIDIIHPTIGLTEERTEFYNLSRAFADNELRPYASKWDRESIFPVDTFKKFGELGFGGIFVKEDVGGSALSRADAISIVEGLATGCVGTTAMLTIHNMCASTIDKFGSDEQRNRWLPSIVSMETLISFCLTEPGNILYAHTYTFVSEYNYFDGFLFFSGSGSDAASLSTKAVYDAATDEYVLNGSKVFISGAGRS